MFNSQNTLQTQDLHFLNANPKLITKFKDESLYNKKIRREPYANIHSQFTVLKLISSNTCSMKSIDSNSMLLVENYYPAVIMVIF
jgi:hypothetical protein